MGPEYCLHLMSVISPIRDDLAVVYEKLAPVAMLRSLAKRGIEWVVVRRRVRHPRLQHPRGVARRRGDGRATSHRRQLRERGVEVHTFDSRESDKGEGGPTCITRPVLRAS